MKIHWQWKSFAELDNQNLYQVLALRGQVFVVEQQCNYVDADGLDPLAMHLLGWDNHQLAAYCRLFPPSKEKEHARLGRVLVAEYARGYKLGHNIVQHAIDYTRKHFPGTPIAAAAQAYLEKFYQNFDFISQGEPYDDHGIMHIDMILPS